MQQKEHIFGEIVRENHGRIYRICLAYLYDKSHAADLYQEILLQIWKSLDNFKGAATMGTWIYRIAVNTAITYNTQHKKNKLEALPETFHPADDHSAGIMEKESQLSRLHLAISQLEEQDRLIISLVLEDMTYKDIADITGSNTNNIGVRITRIKARLLKLMNDKTAQDGF